MQDEKNTSQSFLMNMVEQASSDDGRCIEELVGEIYDEYDDVKRSVLIKESENTYYLSADLELMTYDTLDLGSPQEDRYLTVGSYIYEL